MIRFTFDNDALEHLVLREDYLDVEPRVLKSIERKISLVYFSRTNLLEMVKGANEDNLNKLRAILIRSYSLSAGGHILASTAHHLRFALGKSSRAEQLDTLAATLNDIKQMATATDFEEFRRQFGESRDRLVADHQAIFESARTARKNILERIRRKAKAHRKSAEWFLSAEGSSLFYDVLFPHILMQFHLQDVVGDMERSEITARLPSLFQYAQAFRSLLRRRIVDNAKARPGDYFDIQKVAYLDLCDYIVSDDRVFREKVLDRAGTGDLHGRAISLAKFLDHVDRPFLINRLTSSGYDSSEIVRLELPRG